MLLSRIEVRGQGQGPELRKQGQGDKINNMIISFFTTVVYSFINVGYLSVMSMLKNTVIFGSSVRDSVICPLSLHRPARYCLRLHFIITSSISKSLPMRVLYGFINKPLLLKTRCIGAEVAGVRKLQ